MKRKRIILASDLHYCESGFYGMSRDEIAENLCNDLKNEYSRDPYSALLLLGDYSLDWWGDQGTWQKEGFSDAVTFLRNICRSCPQTCRSTSWRATTSAIPMRSGKRYPGIPGRV